MTTPRKLEFPCLIVSCQARDDNPLTGSVFMRAMALAAEMGGAQGIRANGPDDVRAIREAVQLPVIGLEKKDVSGFEVYITPDLESVQGLLEAGSDLIALDATLRARPVPLEVLFGAIHAAGRAVFADCATLEDAVNVANLGADVISTTMAGYTPQTVQRKTDGPDFELLEAVIQSVHVPVVAEGRFWTPEDVVRAFALGARGVVVGTAITNPREITRRFMQAVPKG
jgi:putative N-acetylmannosamine-6-phosphate epimerase